MTRKGVIAEIFSKALHHDSADLYVIGYLDFDTVKEVALPEFLKLSENFEIIPATRIVHIRKGKEILYSKQDGKSESSKASF